MSAHTPYELLINPPQEVFDQLIDKSAATDGWAHQPYDYAFWRQNFDDYWYFAIVEKGTLNLICGACLAKWDEMYSIGLYYCMEKFRGQGFGSKIFKAMMEIVGDSEACLTGAMDMIDKYVKYYGFGKISNYWYLHSTIQMPDLRIPGDLSQSISTKSFKEVSPEAWNTYDSTICPKNRQNMMQNWFKMDQVYTRVAFDSENRIVGYGTIRVVNLNRLCACPFYADSLQVAERLLADILNEIPKFKSFENLFFWHPETNGNMKKLFEKFSINNKFTMEVDFKTQFRKNFIDVPQEKVYSVACSTHQFA